MKNSESLNPLASRVWTALLAEYPNWKKYFDTCRDGDLEIAVPAPPGSNAGHLVISTANGKDLWIRYGPPYMSYSLDDEREMLDIVRQLLAEQVVFVVIMRGNEWVETTLTRLGQALRLERGQVAHIVS